MNMFYSGGGSPWLAEVQLDYPCVMLSFWTDVAAEGKPGSRIKQALVAKRKKKKIKGKKKER